MRNMIILLGTIFLFLAALGYAAQLEADSNVEANLDNKSAELQVELDNKGEDVDEVRFYIPELDNVQCGKIPGWKVMKFENFPNSELGETTMCWYYTEDKLEGTQAFSFNADAPEDISPIEIKFELREDAEKSGIILTSKNTYEWEVQ